MEAGLAKYATVNTYQAQLFAKFLEKLRATPDGDGTLLDHSMFLYGAGLSNPNLHAHTDLPLAVFGGGIKAGRHIVAPKDTPPAIVKTVSINARLNFARHFSRRRLFRP